MLFPLDELACHSTTKLHNFRPNYTIDTLLQKQVTKCNVPRPKISFRFRSVLHSVLRFRISRANVVTKVDDQPYLCLISARDIREGEELQYDYGERSQKVVKMHPWLAH